jgi:hypothetical protein
MCALGFVAFLLVEKAAIKAVPAPASIETCREFTSPLPTFRVEREKTEWRLVDGCTTVPDSWISVNDEDTGVVAAILIPRDTPMEQWVRYLDPSRIVILSEPIAERFRREWQQWKNSPNPAAAPALPPLRLHSSEIRVDVTMAPRPGADKVQQAIFASRLRSAEFFEAIEAPTESLPLPACIELAMSLALGIAVLWFARTRWTRPPRRVRAITPAANLTLLVTNAAKRLDAIRFARPLAAIAVGLWFLTSGHLRDEATAVQLVVAFTCAAFVYIDFPRNGPLAPAVVLALLANAVAVLVLAGDLHRFGHDVSVSETIAFGMVAPLIVGYGAWTSWKLTRLSVPELAPARLSIGDAALVRPGWFASGKYLRVMGLSFLMASVAFLRLLPIAILGTSAAVLQRPSPLLHRLRRRRACASAVLAEHWQLRDERIPILLIRSFEDDSIAQMLENGSHKVPVFEDGMIEALWSYAPVVALGNPVEKEITPGALRTYFRDSQSDDKEWRKGFEAFATRAQLIVAFVGATPSLAWELNRISELGLLHKLVLLVPALEMGPTSDRWDALRANLRAIGSRSYAGLDDIDCGDLVATFPADEHWVFIRAKARTQSAYQIALRIAAQLSRPTVI